MYQFLKSILPVVLLAFGSSPAAAQTIYITLQERAGDGAVEGRLISFSDTEYTIATSAGPVSVNSDTVDCVGRACPMLALPQLPEIATNLQRIELSALGGSIDVTGSVLGFVDDHYIVDVPNIGLVKLRRQGLRCSGPGCRVREVLALADQSPQPQPAPEAEDPQIEVPESTVENFPRMIPVVGEKDLTKFLLPSLLEGFSAFSGENQSIEVQSQSSYSLDFGPEGNGFFVGGTGADAAFYSFTAGGADFALTSRRLSEADVKVMTDLGVPDLRGSEYEAHLGSEALNVAVNPALAIDNLQYAEIAAIFRGEIRNWADLGGPDAPIKVIHREFASAARTVFDDVIFNGTSERFETGSIIANSTEEMASILARDPHAIGYLRRSAASELKEMPLVETCGLLYRPSIFSDMAQDSPMQIQLYLYSHPEHVNEIGREFFRYVNSDSGRAAVSQALFSGADILSMPLATDSRLIGRDQLQNNAQRALSSKLEAELPLWDRLSTTFRFPTGTMELGQKEEDDLAKLVSYLAKLPQGSEIALVGFADSSGDFRINQRLSKQRSEFIQDLLIKAGGSQLSQLEFSSLAFGELGPVRCNTSPRGRAQNRRVEVWLRSSTP